MIWHKEKKAPRCINRWRCKWLKENGFGYMWHSTLWAVGNLVVRASNSRPKSLGSMPDADKYPRSTSSLNQWVRKSCGLYHECRGLENISLPLQSHGKIVEVEIGGVAIYRPFGEFHRANSYCHLYGAQGLGQPLAYF
ncbi:hypothetical protein TNCV_4117701 [Trichonephila clavipes]|nr:hypothetical protein TNCV_4117701 [Trichonephila clavipes]